MRLDGSGILIASDATYSGLGTALPKAISQFKRFAGFSCSI